MFKTLMRKYLRKRFLWLFIGSLVAFAGLWIADPSNSTLSGIASEGTGFIVTIQILTKTFVYFSLFHIGRKIIFDYIDICSIYTKVMKDENSTGAGLFMIGVGLFSIAIAIVIAVAALA